MQNHLKQMYLKLLLHLKLWQLNIHFPGEIFQFNLQQFMNVIRLKRFLKRGQIHIFVWQNDCDRHFVSSIWKFQRLAFQAQRIDVHLEALAI